MLGCRHFKYEDKMIPRYSREEMASIWSEENKYRIWLEIELYAAEAMAELGIVPAGAVAMIREKAQISPARIQEIEATTKHDVIAFLTNISESVGPEARFLHQGMTSSDVLDTCLAVQLTQAADLLLSDIEAILAISKRRAYETKDMACIGRSHGIHAEPTTMGLKFAAIYAEFNRHYKRLKAARDDIGSCAISGAVGTFAHIPPQIQQYVADKLGLASEPISTQVIPRDRHAMFFATLGVIASSIERVAIEVRHLQRSEVREAEEYFSAGQKGSSAMPHKRNPVLSENITGLARMVRAYVMPAMENVALWHERDISHSSVERMIGPDATVTLDFALARLASMLDQLVLYPEQMQRNIEMLGGIVHSQAVLLALTQANMPRERAYHLVQEAAMKTWSEGSTFLDNLTSLSDIVAALPKKELERLCDTSTHTRHVEHIFNEVFGSRS
jgi:adenylosuccinate lyase